MVGVECLKSLIQEIKIYLGEIFHVENCYKNCFLRENFSRFPKYPATLWENENFLWEKNFLSHTKFNFLRGISSIFSLPYLFLLINLENNEEYLCTKFVIISVNGNTIFLVAPYFLSHSGGIFCKFMRVRFIRLFL